MGRKKTLNKIKSQKENPESSSNLMETLAELYCHRITKWFGLEGTLKII